MSFISQVPMSELQAVNMLLAAIGEAAVSNLETATTVEVTQAKNLLSNTNRAIQQKGWHFNTEWDVVMALDSESLVPVGSNAVTIVLLDFVDTPQTFRQYVTLRSARIFQEEIIGQTSAEQINRIEESEAYADLLDDETDRAGYNVGYSDIEMYNITKKHRKVW